MNLYSLRYFVTLAHMEHYTKAAAHLGITQPALTHAISCLQKELGVSLFIREGRYVRLTRAGELYLKRVEKGLHLLEEANQSMKRLSLGEGEVRLGFLRESGVRFLPTLIHDFMQLRPHSQIHFSLNSDSGMSADLLEGLRQERYDLIFTSTFRKDADLEYTPVYRQPLYLAVPFNHALSDAKKVILEQLTDEPMILFSHKSGLRFEIDRLFNQAGLFPKQIVFEISEDEVIASFVEKGFGLAILPDIPIIHQMNIAMVPIDAPHCYREINMIMKKKADHFPVVQAFYDFVKQNVCVKKNDPCSVENESD